MSWPDPAGQRLRDSFLGYVDVAEGAVEVTIPLPTQRDDYVAQGNASWNTSVWVSSHTTVSFTLTFAFTAPAGGRIWWRMDY